jgi:urease gamma subunit
MDQIKDAAAGLQEQIGQEVSNLVKKVDVEAVSEKASAAVDTAVNADKAVVDVEAVSKKASCRKPSAVVDEACDDGACDDKACDDDETCDDKACDDSICEKGSRRCSDMASKRNGSGMDQVKGAAAGLQEQIAQEVGNLVKKVDVEAVFKKASAAVDTAVDAGKAVVDVEANFKKASGRKPSAVVDEACDDEACDDKACDDDEA